MLNLSISLRGYSLVKGIGYCNLIKPGAGELEIILNDIEKALAARLWYAALTVTLSLPDICSLLERPEDERWSKREKYAAWFNEHVAKLHYPEFTGDDCYSLRGGVVHHGQFGHAKSRYDRVAFSLPDGRGSVFDRMMSTDCGSFKGTTLSLDLALFCQRLIEAVRTWYRDNADDPNVVANLPNLVRYRDVMEGHSNGIPMIA